MDGSSINHLRMVLMRRFKDASKVSLRFHSSRPAPLLLAQPHVLSAAHETTSVENGEQILRDV
ncbi:MAG: hypothetical protein QF531_04165, partial [Candidatus Poseidonia sp.]|nr:hypothetical protein [Poseidonia sp.]